MRRRSSSPQAQCTNQPLRHSPEAMLPPRLTLVWQAKPRMMSGRAPKASQEGLKAFTCPKGSSSAATSCAERNTIVPTTTRMQETADELTAGWEAGQGSNGEGRPG